MRVLGLALAGVLALSAGCGSGDGGKSAASAEPSASASHKPQSLPGIDTGARTPRERRALTAPVGGEGLFERRLAGREHRRVVDEAPQHRGDRVGHVPEGNAVPSRCR